MNVEGGKKRVSKKSSKKGGDKDQDGGAVDFGTILTPLVLYGLRQAVTPDRKAPMKGRRRRGGAIDPVFVSQPALIEGGVEDVLSKQLPSMVAKTFQRSPSWRCHRPRLC